MNTVLYKTTEKDIEKAAEVLKHGGLIAFPTETVYGLGADAFDPAAAKKAYAAKGRPSDNPLIVHISKFEDLYRLVPKEAITDRVRKLAQAFWPGPLTMVLPKLPAVPKETTGGLDTVAIRLPNDEATLKFIELSGTCVSGPSANTSGNPSPTKWEHVRHDLDGKIDGIICGNPCSGGIESTVLDASSLTIFRPGLITPEMIAAVTGEEVSYDKALFSKPSDDPNYKPKAPGMKYKHYAPKAEMVLFEGEPTKVAETLKQRKAEEEAKGKRVAVMPDVTAENFFDELRTLDESGADIILAKALDSNKSINFSIMNRMLKAAGYNIKKC